MPAQPDISMPPMAGTNDAALRAEIARVAAALADARGEMPIPDSREVERVARAITKSLRDDCISHDGTCFATVDDEVGWDGVWAAEVDGEFNVLQIARAVIATTGARVTFLEAGLRAIDKAIDKARDMVPDDGTGDDAALPFCCVLNQAQLDARAARDR